MVTLSPVPVVVVSPGYLVKVHVPEEGNPLNATLPVETPHDGWVIVPVTGVPGVWGEAFITTLEDSPELQPDALATTKVKVPAVSPVTV